MPYIGTFAQGSFTALVRKTDLVETIPNAFTMSRSVGNANDIDVFVENVRQEPSIAYTVSGTTLRLLERLQLVLIISMWFTTNQNHVVPPSKADPLIMS